jgi:hypothetical protein
VGNLSTKVLEAYDLQQRSARPIRSNIAIVTTPQSPLSPDGTFRPGRPVMLGEVRPRRCMGRDDEFSEYVGARWRALVRAAVLLGCSRHDAEDVVQTARWRAATSPGRR